MHKNLFREIPVRRLVFTGAAVSVGIQLIGTALGYLLQVWLARWMGVTEYGTYIYARVWVDFLIVPSSLGFTYSTMRFIPSYIRLQEWSVLNGLVQRSRMMTLGVASLLSAIGIIVLATGTTREYRWDWLTSPSALLLAFGLIPLFALVSLQSEFLRALNKIALAYIPLRIVQPLVLLIIAFVFVQQRQVVTAGRLIQWLYILLILFFVFQFWALRRYLPQEIKGIKPSFATMDWMKLSIPLLIGGSFYSINSYFDILVIGSFWPEQDVAIYNAAVRLAALVAIPLIAVRSIVTPNAAAFHTAKDEQGLQELYVQATLISTVTGSIAFAFLCATGAQLLSLFGGEFTAGHIALQILLLGTLVDTLAGPVGQILNVTGFHKQSFYLSGASALINIALNLVLIPRWGMNGAAVATTTSIVFLNLALYRLSSRNLKLSHALWTALPRQLVRLLRQT